MKGIIVTGATGFIGRNLIRKLLELDFFVYAIIRPGSSNRDKLAVAKNMRIIELDLAEIKKLPDSIDSSCSIFCHLAWDGIRGNDRDNLLLQHNNYLNSLETIKVAKKLGCEIYITAGSQAEYGVCDTRIDENTACSPVTEYGKQKYEFFKDGTVLARGLGMSFKEARFFSLYGSGDYENTMVCSVLNKMMNNDSVDLTEGTHNWNFLNIDDAVNGIVKLVTSKCLDGPYNFSGDETKKLRGFIEIMQKVTKSKSIINFGTISYSESSIVGIDPDNSKLKRETGWSPDIDFATGIKDMINKF